MESRIDIENARQIRHKDRPTLETIDKHGDIKVGRYVSGESKGILEIETEQDTIEIVVHKDEYETSVDEHDKDLTLQEIFE